MSMNLSIHENIGFSFTKATPSNELSSSESIGFSFTESDSSEKWLLPIIENNKFLKNAPSSMKEEGGKTDTMSLCLAIAFDNKLYIAADSKSIFKISETTFGNKTKFSAPASFSYKKIFRIVLNGQSTTPIMGFFVGDNTFDSKNLLEFINDIDFSQCSSIIKVANVICNCINTSDSLSKTDCRFSLFRYENSELNAASIQKIDDKYISVVRNFQPDIGKAFKTAIGTAWAIELSDYTIFPIPERSEEDTLFCLNEIFSKAQAIGHYYDESVGGLIRIGKLTPKGFEWLQNGYEF